MSGMIRALAALAILLAAFAVRASVWFGDQDGLHRVDTATNSADLNIGSSEPVALAVNSTDGSVWALTRSRISKYSSDGTRLFTRSLDSLVDHVGDGRGLAVNAANGSAWVAGQQRLMHLSAGGSLLTVVWGGVTDLAVAQDGTAWVLDDDGDELRRYADEGALLSRTRLFDSASRAARFIELDDTRGAIWLGGAQSLIKRSLSDPSRVLLTVGASQPVQAISLDVQTGELWVLGPSSFYGYGADGTRFVSENVANDGASSPQTLAFDIGTQAIWIGHRRGISRFTRAGDRIATIRAVEVDTVAVSRVAVVIDPTIALVSPAANALINNPRPPIVFQYGANCAGTPCSFPPGFFASFSVTAVLNGVSVGSQFVFDPGTGQTRFTPPTPLPQGVNQITGQAVDAAGHVSPQVSSQFTVDSVAPQFVNVTPVSGSVFTSAQITIQGGTDDPSARVRLSGAAGDAPSSFSFPVTLPTGISSYTLTATDPAGNATQFPLTYTFTPPNVPPTVSITAPANGAAFTAPATVGVTASAADSDGSVVRVDFFSNGAPAGSDATPPSFTTSLANLAVGTYALTAVATDNRNGATTSAPVTITVVPPNVPPTVTLTSPANGATFTALATVLLEATASDSDGTVARVEFLQGGNVIATITSPPYRHTVTGLAVGTYAFAARAVDNANAATVSAAATVSVVVGPPNTPPTVKLTSPSSGSAFSAPAAVTVSATAADADGTIAKVEFLLDGVVAATSLVEPYQANLSNVPAGNHTVAARATDSRGAAITSPAATITVVTLSLSIATPAPNASVSNNQVLVTGHVAGLANSGVSVNSKAAAVDAAGNYSALVALVAGANIITVSATGPDGKVVSQTVTVSATGVGSPFIVFANPDEGLSTLFTATFTVTNPTTAGASFMFDTFGPFDLPAGATLQLSLQYPPGVFVPAIVITSPAGTFTHRVVVSVVDPAQLDQMLRAAWSGLNNALVAGDKEGALRAFNGGAQLKFGPVFDVLMPFMGEIVASYSTLAQSSLTNSIGEYAVSRMDGTQRRVFFIYFLRGSDGVWKIDEM